MSYKIEIKSMNSVVIDSIIEYLENKNKSSFGDMVKNINAPYHEILKHVLFLKRYGVINKIKNPEGYYQISK